MHGKMFPELLAFVSKPPTGNRANGFINKGVHALQVYRARTIPPSQSICWPQCQTPQCRSA